MTAILCALLLGLRVEAHRSPDLALLVQDLRALDRRVVLADVATGARRVLLDRVLWAFDAHDHQHLRWGPRGRRVFFNGVVGSRGVPNEPTHPCVIDLEDDAWRCLARTVVTAVAPSPDGRSVAWSASDVLRILDLEGGEARVAARAEGRSLLSRAAGSPSWLPDGSALIYGQSGGLKIVSSSGGDARSLLPETRGEIHGILPDGRWLVLSRKTGSKSRAPRQLLLVHRESGRERLVAERAGYDPAPTIAADGSRIAFVLQGEGESWMRDVAVVDAGSFARLRVVEGADPSLSDDGRLLAVERAGRIVVVDLDEGLERDLGEGIRPAFRPGPPR